MLSVGYLGYSRSGTKVRLSLQYTQSSNYSSVPSCVYIHQTYPHSYLSHISSFLPVVVVVVVAKYITPYSFQLFTHTAHAQSQFYHRTPPSTTLQPSRNATTASPIASNKQSDCITPPIPGICC